MAKNSSEPTMRELMATPKRLLDTLYMHAVTDQYIESYRALRNGGDMNDEQREAGELAEKIKTAQFLKENPGLPRA